MAGNPKESPWHAPLQADRKRKQVIFTLSDEARAKLEKLVKARGGGNVRSKIVEELILAAGA